MNNEKQLPPELVEKMLNGAGLFRSEAEKCAQIAVNHAEKENKELIQLLVKLRKGNYCSRIANELIDELFKKYENAK